MAFFYPKLRTLLYTIQNIENLLLFPDKLLLVFLYLFRLYLDTER